jgi:uncharacterized protein YndB with AHSA1/START domain
MLKKIGLGLLVVVVVLVAIVATRPAEWHLERSTTVAAPPAAVFPLVNDFRAWQRWSPWEKLDPNLKREYSGAPAGTGSVYSWQGTDDVGAGRMTITESVPDERVAIQLQFLRPFEATNQVRFTFEEAEDGTRVTWGMDGRNGFVAKAFGMLFDVDALVGKDFEKGLAEMKAAAEADAHGGGPS